MLQMPHPLVLQIPHQLIVELGIVVGLAIVVKVLTEVFRPSQRRTRTQGRRASARGNSHRMSASVRSDEEILCTPIAKLTWAELERLLALYFRDQGYEVEETGVGGNDGGVDLVLINKRTGERTAVQVKHWNDNRPVGPNIIRELHSARQNTKPACLYAMLITSSDITQQARTEADARRITYWHGAVLESKLAQWSKWQGRRSRLRPGLR